MTRGACGDEPFLGQHNTAVPETLMRVSATPHCGASQGLLLHLQPVSWPGEQGLRPCAVGNTHLPALPQGGPCPRAGGGGLSSRLDNRLPHTAPLKHISRVFFTDRAFNIHLSTDNFSCLVTESRCRFFIVSLDSRFIRSHLKAQK